MIICPKCRAKLGDGSTVCVVCGIPLGNEGETPAPEPAKPAAAPPPKPEAAGSPAKPAPTPQPQTQQQPQQEQTPGVPPGQAPGTHTAKRPEEGPVHRSSVQQPQQPQNPPAQQPPPPDHPTYQQQYTQYYQPPARNWETHVYYQGQPNQCPRCQHQNVIYYYHDGTAYCTSCYYRFYWKPPKGVVDQFGREFDKMLR